MRLSLLSSPSLLLRLQDYWAISRYVPLIREFLVPYQVQDVLGSERYNDSVIKTLNSKDRDEDDLGLLACTSLFKIMGSSEPSIAWRMKRLRLLEIRSSILYLYHATATSTCAPKEGWLPQLAELHVDLDHPHTDSYRARHEQRRPLEALASFMGSDPNHITIQLVGQLGTFAANLRTIHVHGDLDLYAIEKFSLISQLETLDFSDAAPVGQGSVENFRSIANMAHLQKFILPKSLYAWSTATLSPILPPALIHLTIPEGTVRRCWRHRQTIYGHETSSFSGNIISINTNMGLGALIAFQNPNVTDLRVDCDHLVGASRMVKQLGHYRSLQRLHIELYKWDEGISIGDILAELVAIPDLRTFTCFYYEGRWPMFLPQLGAKDATTIWRAWPQLHSLGLGPVTFAFFEEILRLLPALTALDVNAFCWGEGLAIPSFHHQNMRSLILNGRPEHWEEWDGSISDYVTALFPNLQEMDILTLDERGPEDEYSHDRQHPAGIEPTYKFPMSRHRKGVDCDIVEQVICKVREMRQVNSQGKGRLGA